MATINPYLIFLGNCEEAFNHYKSVFGGEFNNVSRFSDMPPQKGVILSEDQNNKILHISLPIGNDTVLMGSDAGANRDAQTQVGNNIQISVSADNKEQADAIYEGLSQRGAMTMPMQETFWGEYFGMCTDRFGINWMIGVRKQ